MGEALLITDADGKVERANAAAVELFKQDEATLVGKLADDLILTSDRRRTEGVASRPREGTVLRPDGTTVSVSYTVANVRDGDTLQSKVYAAHNIDERKRVEQRIRYLARIDSLTKVANRMQFQHLLQQVDRACAPQPAVRRDGLSRRRPLQGHQRHVRPRRRRHEPRDLRAPRARGARRELARGALGRRRVRGADHGLRAARRDAALPERARAAAARCNGQAVPGSRRGDLPDREHGYSGLSARRRQRHRSDPQRRRRSVRSEEGRRQLLRVLLERHEHRSRRALDAEEQAAPRVRARRAALALSAEVPHIDGPHRRRRGIAAVGPARARPRVSVGFRAARRGNESDPAARRLGIEPRLRRLSGVAARPSLRRAASR